MKKTRVEKIKNFRKIKTRRDLDFDFEDGDTFTFRNSPSEAPRSLYGICRLEIMDTGVGLSSENVKKLFNPFAQAEGSSKYGVGTGLGLWIVKSIALAMNGNVRIHSEEGEGTSVVFAVPLESKHRLTLPSRFMQEQKEESLKKKLISFRYKGMNMLVADSDDRTIITIQEFLETVGAKIWIAHTGIEGLEIYEKIHPEFVICDWKLPLLSGKEMIEKILASSHRSNGKTAVKKSHIIVMTKGVEIAEKEVEAVIQKPVQLSELKGAFEMILERKLNVSANQSKGILIVDDDAVSNQISKAIFEKSAYKCYQAFTVKDAIKIFMQEIDNIGLVLLDSLLPDGRGLDVAKGIRQLEQTKKVLPRKIFSISGNTIESMKAEYEGIDIETFIIKPIHYPKLMEYLKNVI